MSSDANSVGVTVEEMVKSRVNVLKLLANSGYDVTHYEEFTYESMRAMLRNATAHIYVSKTERLSPPEPRDNSALSAFLNLAPIPLKARPADDRALVFFAFIDKFNINELVEDLYMNSALLAPTDSLIVVLPSLREAKAKQAGNKDHDPMKIMINKYFAERNIFVTVFRQSDLQFNGLVHFTLPTVTILSADETTDMLRQFNIDRTVDLDEQLPTISRFDSQMKRNLVRPGQIVRLVRSSPTAGQVAMYKLCVSD